MKLLSYSGLLLAAGLTVGCGSDDPQGNAVSTDLDIEFIGTVGSEALQLESRTYQAPNVAEGFRPSRVSFYATDLRFVEDAGDGQLLETPLAEVAYVELGPGGEAGLTFPNVPTGEYTAFRFRLGLTAELDATTPADYSADHPLGRASEYWADWGSYIFLKLEGRSDTLADQQERFGGTYTYHIGKSADLAREVEVLVPMALDGSDEPLKLYVDVAKLLSLDTPDALSLAGRADHKNDAGGKIMARASDAFSVKK